MTDKSPKEEDRFAESCTVVKNPFTMSIFVTSGCLSQRKTHIELRC